MLKIATPISNLFIDKKCASILIEKSDCLEVRDESINLTLPNIELFHCAIQPIHELHEIKFEYLKKIKSMHPDLKLITFHCASSCNKAYVEGGMFQVGGNNYEKEEMLSNAKYNFSKIKRIFGTYFFKNYFYVIVNIYLVRALQFRVKRIDIKIVHNPGAYTNTYHQKR